MKSAGLVKVVLLNEPKKMEEHGPDAGAAFDIDGWEPTPGRRHAAIGIVDMVAREPELAEIVAAMDPKRDLADFLNRRKQQGRGHEDDARNDDEFNQREAGADSGQRLSGDAI